MSYPLVKLVHVFAMAIWIGGPWLALIGVREELAAGGARGLQAVLHLQRVTKLFIAAALITVATGAVLIALSGGPSHVARRLLWGAALVVPIFVLGGAVVRPALLELEASFRAQRPCEAAARRFFLAARLEDLLRAAVLALMVLPLF